CPKEKTGWAYRLHVFDMGTGQEIWQWTSSTPFVEAMGWTNRNQLFVARPGTQLAQVPDPTSGGVTPWYDREILGFDPRLGKQVFYHHCAEPCYTSCVFSPDGNLLAIGQNLQNKAYRVDVADLRSGVVQPFLPPSADVWSIPKSFSPDSSRL